MLVVVLGFWLTVLTMLVTNCQNRRLLDYGAFLVRWDHPNGPRMSMCTPAAWTAFFPFFIIFYFQLVRSANLSDLCPVLLCWVDGYWCMCLSPQCYSVLAKEEMAPLEHEDDIETWAAVISTHTEACFFGHPSNFGCSNSNGSEYFSGSAWCMANFNMRSIWSHLKALSVKHQETFARFPAIGDATRQHLRANATHVKGTDAKPLLLFLFIAKDWLEDSTFQPSMYSCQGASTSPLLGWPISNGSHSPTSWGDDDENSDQLQPGLEDAEDFSAKDSCILLWNCIVDFWDSSCGYRMMCCASWSSIKELGQRQGGAHITSQFLSQRKPDFPSPWPVPMKFLVSEASRCSEILDWVFSGCILTMLLSWWVASSHVVWLRHSDPIVQICHHAWAVDATQSMLDGSLLRALQQCRPINATYAKRRSISIPFLTFVL